MTTVTGNNVAYGSGGNYYESRIVYTLTYPSNTTYKIDWELCVYHSTSLFDSTNKAGVPSGGDLKGATSYGSKTYSDSDAGTVTYASGTKTGTRLIGSTLVLEQSFWVEDLADASGGGARSTVNATINVAQQPVSVPSTAGASGVSAITDTGCTQTWADPANWNGDDSSDFDVRRATDSGFTSPTQVSVLNANTYPWTGLTGNTTYWVAARAKNSAGVSATWGASVSFLTKPSVPTLPASAGVTTSSATLSCTAPAGGAATYRLQVATDAAFTTIVIDSDAANVSRTVTSLQPNTQYWFRWVARNATGDSVASSSGTFTTLKGMYYDDGSTLKASVPYYDDGATFKQCVAYYDTGSGWRQ